ncbi:hypothetical protein DY000_02031069 [Brassica cretica]|uniref:Uncharacterized protein n=1 Tax=Brassica cretica TaxID=69181 RepID=A0ABQ7E0T4_BRACR|nr:hypothetical protein DY000_02031069 [Brassica cretica]
MTPTESTASCNVTRILTHEEFASKHPHPPSPENVRIARRADTSIDRHGEPTITRQIEASIDRQPPAPFDRRAHVTYRVQIPKIDVARLNELRPKSKPSENPPETVRTPSDDGQDPMEEDRVPTGRTLRRRKEKVAKHLKRGDDEKEKQNFRKRVFRIPIDKPFEDAYYTHRLWMFFRENREKEEDIKRMFCEAREKMRMRRITLKKNSDHGQFVIPCTVEPSQELFTFVDCSQRNSGGIVRDLEVQIGIALVPVDFHVLDIKLNWNSSLLLGRVFLSTVGVVYNLKTNKLCLTLIDPSAHYDPIPVKKPHMPPEESMIQESLQIATVEPDDWENDYYNPTIAAYTKQHMRTEEYDEDYEDERTTEYKTILDDQDTLLYHSSWKRNAPSIDIPGSPSIDTQPPRRNRKRVSTGITNYSSIDAEVNREKMNYMKVSHMRNFLICKDAMKQINIDQKLLGEDTIHAPDRLNPDGHARAIDGQYHQKDTKEFYDAAGGIDKSFKLRSHNPTRPSIVDAPTSVDRQPEFYRRAFDSHGTRKFFWEEKDEYGVYRDEQGYARDLDGNTIRLHNMDIRRTKMVPEIYTKDEINEMFYRICGEQEKNKEAFQMKLDGVYYPLNNSISWLTTCMEEMKQDIARIQHATDVALSSKINIHRSMEEIDQLVEEIYRALETTEERLDGRCDDIYFPMDLDISALTSKIEAIQGELVEIHSYIARRPEASSSIGRHNNKSTDIHQRTSVDDATNRGRLVPKMTSDMSDTHYHGDEISADTYATFRRHQFNLESLEERLQRMENTTATMKEK